MNAAPATLSKRTWLIILAAMVGSVLLYGLLCVFISQSRFANPASAPKLTNDGFRWILKAMSVGILILSMGWMHVKTNGKIGDGSTYGAAKAELMTPADFQTQSIIAMAFAEACSVYGLTIFFMGASYNDFVPFAVGTLLVDVFFILPRGLKYWSSWEQQQKAEEQRASSPFSQSL